MDEISPHGIGGALIPIHVLFRLLGRHDVNEATAKRIKMVSALYVAMQRRRLKLGEQKDPVDLGIDAVGDRDIDEPVLAGQRNRGFATLQR